MGEKEEKEASSQASGAQSFPMEIAMLRWLLFSFCFLIVQAQDETSNFL